MENLIFLIYINRSGSTYLCKLLDEYEDIGVSIEAVFPDGIINRPLTIKNELHIEYAIKKLYKNIKFKEWGINQEDLIIEIKSNNNYPISFDKILSILLKLYFRKKKPSAKIYIYKSPYAGHIREVKKIFPNSKFVFIIRDGRAIYYSQKKSKGSIIRKPMANNPIATAIEYNKVIREIIKYKNKSWLEIIKYEDLIRNKTFEIDKLLKFLNVNSRNIGFSNYFEKIPNNQKYLHKNIKSGPIVSRINAWKKELGIEERFVFQQICFNILYDFNYPMEKIDFRKIKKIYIYYKFYLYYNFRRFLDKFRAFLDFDYLLNRIWYKLFK